MITERSNYEMEAIRLRIQLRKYIKEDIPVINDSKDAVRYLDRRYALIGWQPINCVLEFADQWLAKT